MSQFLVTQKGFVIIDIGILWSYRCMILEGEILGSKAGCAKNREVMDSQRIVGKKKSVDQVT